MNHSEFEAMSIDEMWRFRETVGSVLHRRLEDEKHKLQSRLDELGRKVGRSSTDIPQRRPYPKVEPKFQNPGDRSETWSGRGRQPRWVSELIAAGRNIDDFRILEAAS